MNKKKLIVIAAHPDDEIIGCGGTLLKLQKQKYEINLVFISDGVRGRMSKKTDELQIVNKIKLREEKARMVAKKLNVKNIFFLNYPNLQLHNSDKLEIVKKLIDILNIIKPDTVFIHSNKDLNPDHRIGNECSITALRPTLKKNPSSIYAFEIPSSTDWSLGQFGVFRPNLFIDIEKEFKQKSKLLDIYKNEFWKYPHPMSKKYLKHHSMVVGSPHCLKYCERFEVIKICL